MILLNKDEAQLLLTKTIEIEGQIEEQIKLAVVDSLVDGEQHWFVCYFYKKSYGMPVFYKNHRLDFVEKEDAEGFCNLLKDSIDKKWLLDLETPFD